MHQAVVAHHITGKFALDLHPDDVFWCTADPGWVTGTSYGIIAPLTNGVTSIIDEGDFDAERWYRILQDQRVSVWYTAPTAIRMMMKAGADLAGKYDLPRLRFLASVGEPLNPEAVVWGQEAFRLPFHDNWWQTETGGIMIANYASMDIKPGSMGRPLPGIEAAIVKRTDDKIEVINEPMVQGELALRPGWPSMFRGYLNEPERYKKCFVGGFYLTGDLARNKGKTSASERTIPLTHEAFDACVKLRSRAELFGPVKPEHFVFARFRSVGRFDGHAVVERRMMEFDPSQPVKSWRTAWRKLTSKADLTGLRFHDCRHSSITQLLTNPNVSIQTAKSIAGHIDQRMINRYAHIHMTDKPNAVTQALSVPPEPIPVNQQSEAVN